MVRQPYWAGGWYVRFRPFVVVVDKRHPDVFVLTLNLAASVV
jgi:hypothetical protein